MFTIRASTCSDLEDPNHPKILISVLEMLHWSSCLECRDVNGIFRCCGNSGELCQGQAAWRSKGGLQKKFA
eukprot:6421555-Amphidinium_carterae.1